MKDNGYFNGIALKCNGYNAFRHLWRSLFPIDAKDKLIAMLTVYLDESGTDGRSPIVTVAGYISTVDLWEIFDVEWDAFAQSMEFDIYHRADLLSQRGEFLPEKGWDKERVEMVDLCAAGIISKYVLCGFAAFTRIETCEDVFPVRGPFTNRKLRKKFSHEYTLAGVKVVQLIAGWAKENGYTEPIRFVFEDGAKGKGYLAEIITQAKKNVDADLVGLIGGLSFEDKKAVPQLQSADRLAHLACQSYGMWLRDSTLPDEMFAQVAAAKLHHVFELGPGNLPLMLKESQRVIYENRKELIRMLNEPDPS